MRKSMFLATVAVLVTVSAMCQVTDDAIVAGGFPAALDKAYSCRKSTYVEADLNRDQRPLIVAAYTNCARGIVRVFDKSGQMIAEAADRGIRGFDASIRLADLNGDGIPEILLEMGQGQGIDNPETWVFQWQAGRLKVISPTCRAGTINFTCLSRVDVVDFDGNGSADLLDWPRFKADPDSDGVLRIGKWTLYGLSDGQFTKLPYSFVYARQFRRGTGAPFTSTKEFDAAVGPGKMRVINGTGSDAVESGHIVLNGVGVVGPEDFKRQQHAFEVGVTLKAINDIAVRLEGKPGGQVFVVVEDGAGIASVAKKKGQ